MQPNFGVDRGPTSLSLLRAGFTYSLMTSESHSWDRLLQEGLEPLKSLPAKRICQFTSSYKTGPSMRRSEKVKKVPTFYFREHFVLYELAQQHLLTVFTWSRSGSITHQGIVVHFLWRLTLVFEEDDRLTLGLIVFNGFFLTNRAKRARIISWLSKKFSVWRKIISWTGWGFLQSNRTLARKK